MKEILAIILVALKLLSLWFTNKLEKDKQKRKKKNEALNETLEAIRGDDPAKLTVAFDKLNKLR